jgi:CO/xanthine dehydrogenase FAD-binding subunit
LKVLSPATLAEARAMRRHGAVYAAGLTALPIATGRTQKPDSLIDLARLPELSGVTIDGDMLRIGAMTTLESVRCSDLVAAHAPTLAALLGSVASFQVRRLATIGGNLAWGAGDLIPALLAHRAAIERCGQSLPLEEAFDGELIEAVLLPARRPDWTYAEKVGLREAFSPSVVTIAASAQIAADIFDSPILAIGGGANPPRRLLQAESSLEGQSPGQIDPEALRMAIRTEAQRGESGSPVADHCARVAANLFVAALTEARAWSS